MSIFFFHHRHYHHHHHHHHHLLEWQTRDTEAAELPVCLSESLTYPSNPHATLNKMIVMIKYVQGPIMMVIYDSATCVQAGLVLRLCFF